MMRIILMCVILACVLSSQVMKCPLVEADPDRAARNLLSQSDHLNTIRRSLAYFTNKTLVISIVVREPFVIFYPPLEWPQMTEHERQLAQRDLDNYGGVAIEVMKRLKSIFKFSAELARPADNQFGVYSNELKRWTGLMGQLVEREVDVGLTALSITLTRAQAVDFSRAYYVETGSILIRTPDEIQNYLAIFEPFSRNVWFILLATILTLILLITIMTKLEDNQRRQEKQHQLVKLFKSSADNERKLTRIHEARRYSIKLTHCLNELAKNEGNGLHEFGNSWLERFYYAVTCVVNILLIRDIRSPPHPTPIRILVCVWWLSTIVIVNIYLGILFGQLVVPRRPKSIETLEELVNQEQIEWAVTKGSAIFELFRGSDPGSIYGQLGAKMRNVSSADEGVQRVLESNWAFIRERSILTFKVAQQHNKLKACRMQLAREDFYSVGFGIGLVKNSTYTKPFNSALTLMIENGLITHFQSMYWPKRNEYTECGLMPTEGEPLTVKHFISIYLVCCSLIALALTALVYQIFHKRVLVAPKITIARAGRDEH